MSRRTHWVSPRVVSLLVAVVLLLIVVDVIVLDGRRGGRESRPATSGDATTTSGDPPAPKSEAGTASPPPALPGAVTPSPPAPPLRPAAVDIRGNTLVGPDGTPIRLLGVNRSGAEYACAQGWGIFDGPTDAASVAAIAAWRANAVRIPLNEHCWLGINGVKPELSGATYQEAVSRYVDEVNRAGLVAVLDLHWTAAGRKLAKGTEIMPNADHSPEFWRSVAVYFRDRPGVVFDLFNEPRDVSWECWRDGCTVRGGWRAAGMQSLVDAVRFAGATQPVVVSGLDYANDLSGWLSYRPNDPLEKMAAGFHIYNFNPCNTVRCWEETVAPVAAAVPVVTAEMGQDGCRTNFIDSFMRWADGKGVSYMGWSWNTWHCSHGPALIRSYDGAPTAFGAGLHRHLASLASAGTGGTSAAPG